jgi:hypothetical protein
MVLIAAVLLPVMVLASFDFGVTWDERNRHRNGELIWEFFSGLRSRPALMEDGGHLYGGLFDVISVAVGWWLPLDRYVVRHAINAIFGWIGVVYCGRLAARLFGAWSGVLAMILLAVSPRYFADSMNNPKDLPFAAMSIAALYYFSTISPTWPYISRATAIKIIITLALALNIRAGALLYLGYLGMLVAAFAIAERNTSWRRLADTSVRLAIIAVAVLLFGTVFWPWAQGSPLTRPFEALLGFADTRWSGRVLFNGRYFAAANLPWYYAPWWFLISTPPVVIVGAILSISVAGDRRWTLRTVALWAAAALPLFLVIVGDSILYDGVRHLLFIYPILVVLAASGWITCLLARNRLWLRRSAAALVAVGLVNIIAFHVRSHPNQAVYFNELVGGPRGAFAKFDMDYWGNCVLEAVAWSAELARVSGRPVAITGYPPHLVDLDAKRFPQLVFTPSERGEHHLNVRLNRGSANSVTQLANREDALYRVRTPDGAVLCVVLPGPLFAELGPHALLAPAQSSPHSPWSR